MAAPWLNGLSHFSFGCKIYVCSGAIKAEQNTSLTRRNAHNWNSKISANPASILQPVLAK